MDSYKEAFLKFTQRLNTDLIYLEEKSLNDIKDIKSIYQAVSEIEILLASCVSTSNKLAKVLKNQSDFSPVISENCKIDENQKTKILHPHKTIANFSKKLDKNYFKINRLNDLETKKNYDENEKKNYPKTPIKNKENYSSIKFNTTNTVINDLNEEEIRLSKLENTPNKTLTKSVSRINMNSPVKHTISSLNKTRTKESIEREIQQKKEEKEYDYRLTRINYQSKNDDNNIVLKTEVSPEVSKISKINKKVPSDELNKDEFVNARQTIKSSKSTKKTLNTNISDSNLSSSNNTNSSKNLNREKSTTYSTNKVKNDIKEEDSTCNSKTDVKRKSTTISKVVNNRETINNQEPIGRKFLNETKTKKKITRNKTPFVKEKAKESEKTVNKTLNINYNINNNIANTPIKDHKYSDLIINGENGSKSLANTNNVNNRKSFSKRNVKNETVNLNGNAHSDGKSLVRTKTEKVIVSNFNPTDKAKNILDMDKNKKILKKEKTEGVLNKNSSVSVTKLRQTIGSKNFGKAKDSNKDVIVDKNFDRKYTENGEPNGNSSSTESPNNILEEEKLIIIGNNNNSDVPQHFKPAIRKIPLSFKKLKHEALVNISKFLIQSSNLVENKQVLMKINKTFSKIALDNIILHINQQKEVIATKFDIFKNKHKIEDLTKEAPNFNPSMGALRAVEMLNGSSYKSIFLSKTMSNPEVLIAYRVYFQLFDYEPILKIQDNQEFFNKACEYLTQHNPEGKIAEIILASVKLFDFSSENVYKINKIVGNNIGKITPTYYSKLCAATGLLMFLLKDAIEYAGVSIVEKKTPIQRIYNNYNYSIDIFNSKIERLSYYLMKYHGQK